MLSSVRARGVGPPIAIALVVLLAAFGLWGLSLAGALPSARNYCAGWTGYRPLPSATALAQCSPNSSLGGF